MPPPTPGAHVPHPTTPKAVDLYTSTGGAPLQKRASVAGVPGVAKSDLHVGVLRLPRGGKQLPTPTAVYYSNLWIEAGPPSGLR
jgi:hypothetical protein